ncbi:MAG TPA: hypothetical protein VF681_05600 [Abditibacteriaceae bacterium]|jgi:hypothetical protein
MKRASRSSRSLWQSADDILRGHALQAERAVSLPTMVAVSVVAGMAYGALMGTFSTGFAPSVQIIYSAIKVPLLPAISFALGLPSLFIATTLLGLRNDFPTALRAFLAAAAGQALVLAAFAPLTLLCYRSTRNYNFAVLFNVLMFALAAMGGGILLRRYFQPLIARDIRHQKLLLLWLALSTFSGVQTAWMLRPFIGDPQRAPAFIRTEGWSNAYEQLAHLALSFLR